MIFQIFNNAPVETMGFLCPQKIEITLILQDQSKFWAIIET